MLSSFDRMEIGIVLPEFLRMRVEFLYEALFQKVIFLVTPLFIHKVRLQKPPLFKKGFIHHKEGIPGTKQKERGVQEAESSWSQDQKLDQMRRMRAKWFKDEPYEPYILSRERGKQIWKQVFSIFLPDKSFS